MASSRRSTARAKSSAITSRGLTATSTSSPTTSTSSITSPRAAARPTTCVIALGSNLGDRRYHLARAIHAIRTALRVVRVSSIIETDPVDAPPPKYLNAVVTGYTSLDAEALMSALLAIESRLGRVRRGGHKEPRIIDIDLIFYGGHRRRSEFLTVPHPRYAEREFVTRPLAEISAVSFSAVRP